MLAQPAGTSCGSVSCSSTPWNVDRTIKLPTPLVDDSLYFHSQPSQKGKSGQKSHLISPRLYLQNLYPVQSHHLNVLNDNREMSDSKTHSVNSGILWAWYLQPGNMSAGWLNMKESCVIAHMTIFTSLGFDGLVAKLHFNTAKYTLWAHMMSLGRAISVLIL